LEYDAHGQPDKAREYWVRYLDWLSTQDEQDLDTPRIRRRKAETLLFLGRNEEALALSVALAKENPENIADLGRLGVVHAKTADRIGAERISEILIPMNQPFRGGDNTAWRAYIAGYLGDLDQAVRYLDQAIDEGWEVGLNPHRSQYLKPLRGYGSFEQLVRPRG